MTAHQSTERWSSWQAMDSGRLLLLAAAGMLTVAAIAHTATVTIPPASVHVAVAFGILIALGELLRLGLPGGREAAPIATAGAMAYALLLSQGTARAPSAAAVPPLQVIAVTAIGMTIGALPHLAAGRAAGVTAWRPGWSRSLRGLHFPPADRRSCHRRALVAGGQRDDGPADIRVPRRCGDRRADQGGRPRGQIRRRAPDEMRVQWPLAAAVGVSAMILAFATESMGIAALAVFVVPLLVTQLAFRRYAGIRSTYLQTVRALARVTEVGGYVESGHSHRVSVLAVAVGRVLGMNEPDLLDLEYAALMHDIGQLSLRDPIPGGATVLVSRADQQRIAELGADVIAKAASWTGWLSWSAARACLPAAPSPGRRSAAGSSGPPTPLTTWSAVPPTGIAARPRWSGSGWTPRRSTTPASSRRSARSRASGGRAACSLPGCSSRCSWPTAARSRAG